jgi:hypothetical protein
VTATPHAARRPDDDDLRADAPAFEFEVTVVHGGGTDGVEEAALLVAVRRALTEREARRDAPASTWSLAGRLEAADGRRIRSRAHMPGVPSVTGAAARASSSVA